MTSGEEGSWEQSDELGAVLGLQAADLGMLGSGFAEQIVFKTNFTPFFVGLERHQEPASTSKMA